MTGSLQQRAGGPASPGARRGSGHGPRLEIAVLAAGFSRRLGSPKALARVHGETLLHRTLRQLLPFAALPVLVVVPPRAARYAAELRGSRARMVVNQQRGRGLSSSIRRGLARARWATAVLFVPVDLARIERGDVARLIARWRAARRRVVAARVGEHGGIPLILPRWLFSRAASLSGDTGLKELLRTLSPGQTRLIEITAAEWDVDIAADLAAARRRGPRIARGGRA